MYEPTWLGRPIIQFPNDVVAIQELLWKLQPDVVIETGVAHGGSLVLSASILHLIGKGKVIGVDIEIRPHNRVAIEAHPLSQRIELIEGSSIDDDTMVAVRRAMGDASVVVVFLDSNHSESHVLRELELYSPYVSPGSYIVAHDGAQGWVWEFRGASRDGRQTIRWGPFASFWRLIRNSRLIQDQLVAELPRHLTDGSRKLANLGQQNTTICHISQSC